MTLTPLQKKWFKKFAEELIEESIKYPDQLQKFSWEIDLIRARLLDMENIASLIFSADFKIDYTQSMNYFAKLISLTGLMAYKIEGSKFSGFMVDELFGERISSRKKSWL